MSSYSTREVDGYGCKKSVADCNWHHRDFERRIDADCSQSEGGGADEIEAV